jgi:hypothetical protein
LHFALPNKVPFFEKKIAKIALGSNGNPTGTHAEERHTERSGLA